MQKTVSKEIKNMEKEKKLKTETFNKKSMLKRATKIYETRKENFPLSLKFSFLVSYIFIINFIKIFCAHFIK